MPFSPPGASTGCARNGGSAGHAKGRSSGGDHARSKSSRTKPSPPTMAIHLPILCPETDERDQGFGTTATRPRAGRLTRRSWRDRRFAPRPPGSVPATGARLRIQSWRASLAALLQRSLQAADPRRGRQARSARRDRQDATPGGTAFPASRGIYQGPEARRNAGPGLEETRRRARPCPPLIRPGSPSSRRNSRSSGKWMPPRWSWTRREHFFEFVHGYRSTPLDPGIVQIQAASNGQSTFWTILAEWSQFEHKPIGRHRALRGGAINQRVEVRAGYPVDRQASLHAGATSNIPPAGRYAFQSGSRNLQTRAAEDDPRILGMVSILYQRDCRAARHRFQVETDRLQGEAEVGRSQAGSVKGHGSSRRIRSNDNRRGRVLIA